MLVKDRSDEIYEEQPMNFDHFLPPFAKDVSSP